MKVSLKDTTRQEGSFLWPFFLLLQVIYKTKQCYAQIVSFLGRVWHLQLFVLHEIQEVWTTSWRFRPHPVFQSCATLCSSPWRRPMEQNFTHSQWTIFKITQKSLKRLILQPQHCFWKNTSPSFNSLVRCRSSVHQTLLALKVIVSKASEKTYDSNVPIFITSMYTYTFLTHPENTLL